jgi:hypothetical protein
MLRIVNSVLVPPSVATLRPSSREASSRSEAQAARTESIGSWGDMQMANK